MSNNPKKGLTQETKAIWNKNAAFWADYSGELITRLALKISTYIRPAMDKMLGVIGQPEPHYYFHRPLSLLLKAGFQTGFVLDGLVEPVFDQEIEGRRPFSWANFKQILPVLVARMRLSDQIIMREVNAK